MKKDYIVIGIVSLFVIASIIYGFTIVGFPADSRGKKFDVTRVDNLRSIKSGIESFARSKNALPQTLKEANTYLTYSSIKDPETEKEYGYFVTGKDVYKLCANFATASEEDTNTRNGSLYYDSYTAEFKHPKGEHCFELTVLLSNSYGGVVYSYPTPTLSVQPTPQYDDANIQNVSTSSLVHQSAKFPDGFFTDEPGEHGFVSDKPNEQVLLTVTFFKPVKLSYITNVFDKCTLDTCTTWSAQATTEANSSISLANNVAIVNGQQDYPIDVTTDALIKSIHFRVAPATVFPGWNKEAMLYWSKIKFTYKN